VSVPASRPPQAPVPLRTAQLAARIRDLGPLAQPIGRFLALRPDFFDPAERRQLLDLGDAPPVATAPATRAALEATVGSATARELVELEPIPARATPLAHVHHGLLADGTAVDVKIVRAEGPAAVAGALSQLDRLVGVVPTGALDGVADWLDRQLDLGYELANLERLRRLAATSPWEHVPRPYVDLCSSTTLVTASVSGIPLASLLVAVGSGTPRDETRIEASPYDPWRLARVLVAVNLRQAFRYRFFQADLHPDNILVLPGDVVAFNDYSYFGESDPSLAGDQLAYLAAVFEDDVDRMLDPPVEAYSDASRSALGRLRRDLLEFVRARETQRTQAVASPNAVPGEFLVRLLAGARARGIEVPAPAQLLYRSIATAETVARRLDGRSDPTGVAREYVRVAQLDAKIRNLQPERLESTFLSLATLLRDAPGQLQKILSDLADETFSLNVRVTEVPHVERNRNRRARLTAAAICSVAVAILLTAPHLPRPFGVSIAWFLGLALALLYAWILFEWRRLR
jgi:ubiquinone biosynthesis protein